MSKIYEALLRAEKEKAAHPGIDEPAPKMGKFSLQDEADPVFNESGSSRIVQRLAADASSARPATGPLPGADRTYSPIATTLRTWQPTLDELPALQARGGKVEQFRSLRSKLFGLRHVQPLKSIYIGSGRPEEGKSFVASNLAVALARHKASRVLLIDGDMRQGMLHKVFGCSNEPGLAEYLSGKADLNEVCQQGTANNGSEPLPQGLATLTFCSCGHAGDRAAELSGSPRFVELMRAAGEQFDWVIVDSSPVNLVADGVNLARACDSALLVVRGGVTEYESAQRALRELKAAKVLGVVLNAVDDLAQTDGHYGYQSYESVDG